MIKKSLILMLTLLIIFTVELLANWVKISENSGKELFECISSDRETTQLKFSLPGYEKEIIVKNDEEFQKISCENESRFIEVGKPDLPRISRLIAIPDVGYVSVEVINVEDEILSDINIYPYQGDKEENNSDKCTFMKDDCFYKSGKNFPPKIVKVGSPAIMRDFRVVSVTVNPFQYNPQTKELRVIKNAEIKVTCNGKDGENIKTKNRKRSRFFKPLYKSVILNYDTLPKSDEYQQPNYLFIYPDNSTVATNLQYLVDWKHQKGFEVIAASTAETGTNSTSIKSYIQNAYDNWENPPEFICIVGDAGGSYSIPTGHYSSGEGDQYYVLLEGNDILADAFIGRLSFNSILQFQTILNKILHYEKEPYMDEADWYRNVLLVGDPTHSDQSTIITNKYIKEIMQSAGHYTYAEVYSSPFVSQMSTALNSGVSYFNYRGYLGMSGWDNSDTGALYNGYMLPVVMILTCGTGDFEGTGDCRSEYFLKVGSPTNPKGAIAAVGTATLSTHTCFNNCVDAGTFSGIFVDKIYNMGGALTRGKLNLYNNYPNNPNDWVNCFSYWNNLMGDPGMEIWTGIPQEMTVTYDSQLPLGSNYIEITVKKIHGGPIENAWVTALKGDDEIFATGFTDNTGKVFLPINASSLGTVNLTVTKHNYIPHLGSFDIIQEDYFANILDYIIDDDNSGTSSGNADGIINPGENIELRVRLKNYSNQTLNSVSATLSSDSHWVTITDSCEDYDDIAPGNSTYSFDNFDFSVDPSCPGGAEIQFDLLIEDGSGHQWDDKIYLNIEGPNLYAKNYSVMDDNNGILDPGETAELVVTLKNVGSVTANNISGILRCSNSAITITDSIGYFGNILPNNEGDNNSDRFELSADTQIIPGTQIPFTLLLTNSDGYNDEVSLTVEVGQVFITDPLGPDECGYYCYDSGDTEYDIAPIYSWIEIDPNYGGSGTIISLTDPPGDNGDIETISLPFNFIFYGRRYSNITVCSNGWLVPGITEQYSFMNWRIPGPMGPSPMIAPFWDNLRIGGGRVCYYSNVASHYFIVEWSRLQNDWDGSQETFQVVLFDPAYYSTPTGDGEVLVQYKTINNVDVGSYDWGVEHGQYATVGLEDYTGTIGLEYTYNNVYPTAALPLANNMALLFTTRSSDVLEPPEANVTPNAFDFALDPGDSANGILKISNSGHSNLLFSIGKNYPQDKDAGGPDAFGYSWIDSDETGGPEYSWVDIGDVGAQVSFTHNDYGVGPFDIGFDFEFYGETYTQFIINPNGWIGFGYDNTVWQNTSIPNSSAPRPAILGFWDDLDPIQGGNVYYYSNGTDSLIVWFDNVIHYPGTHTGTYDFEMILTGNGRIKFQYRSVSGTLNSSTIGIQNADGTIGLQVAYNENYIHNNLAIEFVKQIDWLTLDINNGIVLPDSSQDINLIVNTDELETEIYLCNLIVTTNDPEHSLVTIPVNLIIGNVENGWIQGTVSLDGGHGNVEDVEVAIVTADTTFTVHPDGSGFYSIEVEPGTYNMTASLDAYIPQTFENVQVNSGQTTNVDFTLEYIVSIGENLNIPKIYAINQNHPNPFILNTSGTSVTKIGYQLPKSSEITISIYNIRGELVKTLVNEREAPGYYDVIWDGKDDNNGKLGSGIYFYRLDANNKVIDTKKCLLLR